ncbi:hypothetical protein AOC36_06225 [Erysipelothrix larvae]|uniref:HTH marR-type domain-containing protein n=1 Tax=Erysipelothrix larvae TaxID=1514105 RepID=A0A0X8H016_9FIRM|nr:helix-turn-helix domain-containing protein [Erysipelothrix larvae]AMC93594.1 hypothetical protein AOC36_06225 [Erysipelothrix larvae]
MNTHQDELTTIFDALLEITGKMNQRIEKQSKALGYTAKEYLVLLDVLTHPGTSQNAMCERLGIKKSAASKLLRNLESSGKIVRKACKQDKRESELFIEQPELLDTLCKASAIEMTFENHDDYACKLNSIHESLIDLDKMLCGDSK